MNQKSSTSMEGKVKNCQEVQNDSLQQTFASTWTMAGRQTAGQRIPAKCSALRVKMWADGKRKTNLSEKPGRKGMDDILSCSEN